MTSRSATNGHRLDHAATRRRSQGERTAIAAVAALAIAAVAGGCDDSPPANPDGGGQDAGQQDTGQQDVPGPMPQKLVILHTNDLHSHFMGHQPEADYTPATPGDDATIGGFARLTTAIAGAKMQAALAGKPVLLLDAGDFMMGTLFSFLATAAAPELTYMRKLGYDATTVGNHELDYTPLALAGILKKAADLAVAEAAAPVPVLASNMKFDPASAGDDQLEQLAQAQVLRTSMMKTVGGLKVGLFGLMGKDAADVTPTKAPLVFEDIVTAAKRMVMELRAGGADLVIALSHSGIDGTGKGEDEVLARMAPGIDVIVSGHTHDKLEQPVRVGNTVIVTAGSYGRYLGKLDLSVTPPATAGGSPTVAIDGYVLQSIDDQIPGDPATQAAVDQYIAALDGTLMSSGLGYKKVLAETDADLPQKTYEEAPIGNLVTDGYRMVTAQLAQAQMIPPPVISVEGNGQLRTSISKGTTGQIWLADLFRVTPIGIGPDQKPGFPLVTYHLHAGDLASGLELGAAAPLVPDQFFLQVSGLTAEVDMSRPPFGRVVSITLAGETTPLDLKDTTRCFKVVTTNYVAGLLGVVSTQTQGALPPVVAKEADCTTPIADPTTRFVDADPVAPGVQELKQWQAVMKFVTSPAFLDTDGDMIPNIPAAYTMAQGRIVKR